MTNFILRFGKYKGQQFSSTPTNYQIWLLSQDWFKMPNSTKQEKTYSLIENGSIHTDGLSYDDATEMLNRHKSCFPNCNYEILECSQTKGLHKSEGILQRHARIAAKYSHAR